MRDARVSTRRIRMCIPQRYRLSGRACFFLGSARSGFSEQGFVIVIMPLTLVRHEAFLHHSIF